VKPRFFASPAELRDWLDANHTREGELWVGFHKRHTGAPSVTWSQVVDEALCVGWIDGVRRSLGEEQWAIRLTPRKPSSRWSAINLKKVEALIAEGRMRPAGLAAFEGRDRKRADYSYEERPEVLPPELEKRFRKNARAWKFFEGFAPGYRSASIHWVSSAKREDTREKRLDVLIACSARGERIPLLSRSRH
jgi:uncharacterized protein YdeI (YjbR/CyaY-like superfamily)